MKPCLLLRVHQSAENIVALISVQTWTSTLMVDMASMTLHMTVLFQDGTHMIVLMDTMVIAIVSFVTVLRAASAFLL